MTKHHELADSEPQEVSPQNLQRQIKGLEKRIRHGKIATTVGIIAAVGVGMLGMNEIKSRQYKAYDSAQEITLISNLENQEANKNIKIYEGEVNFRPDAKIYESPQNSSNLFGAQEYDKVQTNIVDGKKVFKDLKSSGYEDTRFNDGYQEDSREYEPGHDFIHINYPIIIRQKSETLDKNESKTWVGFKILIDGDYHFYWLNANDVMSAIPDKTKQNPIPSSDPYEPKKGFSHYDSKLPFDFYGQATFNNTIALN